MSDQAPTNATADVVEIGRGTNVLGNEWVARLDGESREAYEYRNTNGSRYVKNFDGSSVYDRGNGHGWERHTSPEGHVTIIYKGALPSVNHLLCDLFPVFEWN